MADSLVPPWLEALLTSPFFSTCPSHEDSPRSERNMFCLDCPSASAFCFYCRSSSHSGHRSIQIRRSSYHDVVRVSEIQTVLDIGGVQTYVINSARVLFLNERPQPKTGHSSTATNSSSISGSNIIISGGGGTAHHICESCSRTLLDPLRFCSLGCKLEGIKSSGNACFVVDDLESGGRSINEGMEIKTKRWRRRVRVVGRGGTGGGGGGEEPTSQQTIAAAATTTAAAATAATTTPANRRRKGTPHRSPLASS